MSSQKFTLRELVWYGFNYMVGVTFTAVFYSLVWGSKDAIGINLLWVMALGGLVATGCAMCFAKLSKIHNADNGAAYIYTRTQLGKFMGWVISFLQYMCLPIIVVSQIMSMVRINFNSPGTFLFLGDYFGNWTGLALDLFGITIYMIASMVIFLGIKKFKKFLKMAIYIKWSSTILLILGVLVLFFMNIFSSTEGNNLVNLARDHSTLSVTSFATAFASTFFFYAGFETYITVGKNVEKPEKNIARSIIYVMLITTVFYLFTTFIFMGAFSEAFNKNPNIQVFSFLGNDWNMKTIGYVGAFIMLFCTMALKLQAGMQNALFSGAILEPQAREGFIPDQLGELDEENIARKANVVNLIVTAVFALIWLIFPDIITGVTGKPAFDYAAITGQIGIFEMILYSVIVVICLKLAFEKKMQSGLFQVIFWMFLFAFLMWQVYEFFAGVFNGINGTLNHLDAYDGQQSTTYFIELGYFILIIATAICSYMFYYLPKYRARLAKDPSIQVKLDAEFTMVDDWALVSREIENYIDEYVARSKKIGLKPDFAYRETANKIKDTIINSEPDIEYASRAKKTLLEKE